MYLALAAVAGLVAGALAAWLIAVGHTRNALALQKARADAEFSRIDERAASLARQLDEARAGRDAGESRIAELSGDVTAKLERIRELETLLQGARASHEENMVRLNTLVAEADKRLADQFKSLAAQILEEKTARFNETSKARLEELLNPFRERLQDFQKKVEQSHAEEIQGQALLKSELDRLMKLNQQVSQDAKNLTTALKGESKTRGNWGEMILEKALELAGLEQGREYVIQDNRQTEDGERRQPDVVIRLPENRNLVIDAKVSLVAYERFANADNETARAAALAEHLASVKSHVRGLGDKNYPSLYGLDSVDFVLMFVPLEPALLAALSADQDLFETALRKDVVLVTPSNLLTTLRVVKYVWRLESQNRNVEEIAKLGGLLYDGFVGFVEKLDRIRTSLDQADKSVDEAFRTLQHGGSSLVRRAERLRELGVKTRKALPESVTGQADDGADEPDLEESSDKSLDVQRPH
jgi:DNA recombination protein RmuC